MGAPKICVVNHEPVFLRLMERLFETEGFETVTMDQAPASFETILEARPDLLLMDTWLENVDEGWALLQILLLHEDTREIPVIICSSDPDEMAKRADHLRLLPHISVLNKPFDPDVLVSKIREMLNLESSKFSRDGNKP